MEKKNFFVRAGLSIKEFFRKLMVSIKRNPQNIPFVFLIFAFAWYSLNTTSVSDTTNLLQGNNMGLAGFVTMLTSILIFVIFLNAFPKRQEPKVIMLILLYVMFALMIYADFYYISQIDLQLAKAAANGRDLNEGHEFIQKARGIVKKHAIFIIVEAALVALLPVYSKLLRKINTSIDVEGNNDMGTIDIAED